jgi:hypothetical protein
MNQVDRIYIWGREVMVAFANALHMRYVDLNILIFVIIGPIVFFVMLWVIYHQYKIIKELRSKILQ